MRPVYETEESLAGELAVAKRIEEFTNTNLHKASRFHSFDFWGFRHNLPVSLVEIKCRTHAADAYPTLIISREKISRLLEIEQFIGVPAFLFVSFAGDLRWMPVCDIPDLPQVFAGRRDREDDRDREPCYDIPVGKFWRIRP
jgi:hypothetical protein